MEIKDISPQTNIETGLKIKSGSQSDRDKFLKILFNEDEGICYGGRYARAVHKLPLGNDNNYEFFSINPLSLYKDYMWYMNEEKYKENLPRRCDWNITCFRNFMFEMDEVPLEQQKEILKECDIPWSTVVFSGGKSYHAILSVDGGIDVPVPATVATLELYKTKWKAMALQIDKTGNRLFGERDEGYVDQSSKNPSRFSRFPMSYRFDKNHIQEILYLGDRISRTRFNDLIKSCPEVPKQYNAVYSDKEKAKSEIEFFERAGEYLTRKIKNVTWGGSAGMYYEVFKLTLWAIDDTNVDKETFLEVLWKYTFPQLIEYYAYPKEKCEIGVHHAYFKKFPGVVDGR